MSNETELRYIERNTRTGIFNKGLQALHRLYAVASGDSGQCSYVAAFLLGLYNGSRFPFDLTALRALDDKLYHDCMDVLTMDSRLNFSEVHTYISDGGKKFEQLAMRWGIEDMELVRDRA
jgi:hypothetical protein